MYKSQGIVKCLMETFDKLTSGETIDEIRKSNEKEMAELLRLRNELTKTRKGLDLKWNSARTTKLL